MNKPLPPFFTVSPAVETARHQGAPIVALESTVITHGLPHPENIHLAQQMEAEVRQYGAVPATIAVLDGQIHVGLSSDQLQNLAAATNARKISIRDFGPAVAQRASGGTTVAGTLYAAEQVGIQLFATGGIGGVHQGAPFDISTDLPQLGKSPVIVVCAGAKAILDLPATLEYLETTAIPVIGYQTDAFPAFYSKDSGLPVPFRADSPEDIVAIAVSHWSLGMRSALLVVVPPPDDVALPNEAVAAAIQHALQEAAAQNIRGQAVTPFLLSRVSNLTDHASLHANLGLLRNNARVASQIAVAYANYQAAEKLQQI